jgi:hypothetical protein
VTLLDHRSVTVMRWKTDEYSTRQRASSTEQSITYINGKVLVDLSSVRLRAREVTTIVGLKQVTAAKENPFILYGIPVYLPHSLRQDDGLLCSNPLRQTQFDLVGFDSVTLLTALESNPCITNLSNRREVVTFLCEILCALK